MESCRMNALQMYVLVGKTSKVGCMRIIITKLAEKEVQTANCAIMPW